MSIKNKTWAVIGCLAMVAGSVWAFPAWMGVYGDCQRHSDGNPGTFTVLMNQDYWGLNAEVGMQVNGGEWVVYPMEYVDNVDGNSRWSFTPSSAFTGGAAVRYYFHGWDEWGGHIWDSNEGNDYTFTVAEDADLTWGVPLPLSIGESANSYEIAAHNGVLYAVWQEGGYYADGYWHSPVIKFSKKNEEGSWQLPVELGAGQYPKIAAGGSGVHVVFDGGTWPLAAQYWRSQDGGTTWSSPITGDFSVRYCDMAADDDYLYIVYNSFSAPDSSKIYFRKVHQAAWNWEPAHMVFQKSSYKATVMMKDLLVKNGKMALATYMQSWYAGPFAYYYHESADNGVTWSEYPHPGRASEMALDDAGHVYLVSYDNTQLGGGLYFTKKAIGGDWDDASLFWDGATRSAAGLQKVGNSLVAISMEGDSRSYRISPDGGATWCCEAPAGSDGSWVFDDILDGDTVHLNLGGATLSTGGHGRGAPVQWIGDMYQWPSDGSVTSDSDLWVNIESWPAGTAIDAYVVYTSDGENWYAIGMNRGGLEGNNDRWYVNLGLFDSGAEITYAIEVIDSLGNSYWDNNGGANHTTVVQ